MVFRYDLDCGWPDTMDGASDPAMAAVKDLKDLGRKQGQPFLISPSGRPGVRINAFFSSRKMSGKSPLTWKKYSYSLGLWLNFLTVLGQEWDAASEEDAEYFKEWRITEAANPERVAPSTFRGDLVALRSFYKWAAHRYGIADPVALVDDYDLMPHGPRQKDIEWLDPAGWRRWRDLGLRGLGIDGRPDPVVVIEPVRGQGAGTAMDLFMLMCFGGRERTVDELTRRPPTADLCSAA